MSENIRKGYYTNISWHGWKKIGLFGPKYCNPEGVMNTSQSGFTKRNSIVDLKWTLLRDTGKQKKSLQDKCG